jgi:hypothetical protein
VLSFSFISFILILLFSIVTVVFQHDAAEKEITAFPTSMEAELQLQNSLEIQLKLSNLDLISGIGTVTIFKVWYTRKDCSCTSTSRGYKHMINLFRLG